MLTAENELHAWPTKLERTQICELALAHINRHLSTLFVQS